MTARSSQDLLAERRANVLESMRERDPMARAMLDAHVAQIDAELAARLADAMLPVGAEVWVFARHWYPGTVRKRIAPYRIQGKTRGPIAEVGYRTDAGTRGQIRKPISELVARDAFSAPPDRVKKQTITEAQAMALDYWRKR